MIPLAHDLEGETVLVVGGGAVGSRRARTFTAEADVVVVSPAFPGEDYGGAARVRRAISPDEAPALLDRYDPELVVCATDDADVNAAVADVARDHGALVNRADEAGGRVTVPASVAGGDVRVALSTGGASPALARVLRERVGSEIAGAGLVADATGRLRTNLATDGVAPDRRREAVRAAARDDAVWAAAGDGDCDRAADAVLSVPAGGER
jgi:precorrin-2 dehydrogenase/sirohydrochlorin ferrochelatase